jgi:site-specific DNA-adenine methylase
MKADDTATPRRRGESDPEERIVSREKDEVGVEKVQPVGIFGYSAGKSLIAKRLVKLFPAHDTYVEPFAGSAALFFAKTEAPVEVLNDQDADVMFAYKAIQKLSKDELAKFASKDWGGSPELFKKLQGSAPTDKLDRLHKFLYVMHFTFGKRKNGLFRSDGVGRVCKAPARVANLQARLKHAKILCGDYEKAIKGYDSKSAFHFLDPPYAGSHAWGEIGEKGFDEARFRKVLEGIKGRFLLTYGTTGKLDTSGFEVKRMRQVRNVRRGLGDTNGKANLTHLIVSNFKVAAKSLGSDVELDDVMQIVDVGPEGEHVMMTGSQTTVSVPEQLAPARKWEHENDLLAYPAEVGAVKSDIRLRFLDKRVEMDFVVPMNDTTIGWTLDVQRAELNQPPELVIKNFSFEGSRFFWPLTKGVIAFETPSESIATDVAKFDEPLVEFGLQTETSHEYFISKSGECAGQLTLGRDADRFPPLFDTHPWLATYIDTKFIPNAVLKGAPMPPDGVSALPLVLEKAIPVEFRYWERKGDEARECRDALIASGFFESTMMAPVDGELAPVVESFKLFEPVETAEPVSEWPLYKAASLLRDGESLVEVFSPGPDAIAKAAGSGRVVYIDAGDVNDGALGVLAKSLGTSADEYIVTSVASSEAHAALAKLGRVFQFRPGEGVGADAVKRLFVASFGVRGDDILWLDKGDVPSPTYPNDPRKPKLREYTTPSDDSPDLGKADGKHPGAPADDDTVRSVVHLADTIGDNLAHARAHVESVVTCKDLDAAHWNGSHAAKHLGEAADHAKRLGEHINKHPEMAAEWRRLGSLDPYPLPSTAKFALASKAAKEKTPRGMLEGFGPPNEWSGYIGMALGPERRKTLRETWDALTAEEKAKVQAAFQASFEKAEFNNPDPGGPGDRKQPRELDKGTGDATFQTGEAGRLQPAVQFDVAGNPKVRERDHERSLKIVKADDSEEHYVLGIVLEPDVVDAQKDIYSSTEVRDACHKYMSEFQNSGLMHKEIVNGKVVLLECYLAPCDFSVGDQHVKKGTWMQAVRVKDAKLWDDVKKGALTGFSIGGSANRQPDPKANRKYLARKESAEKKIAFQGIPIHVDRPKGSVQMGVDAKGNEWKREYKTDYGFIPRTKGGDGEGLDVFVGPNNNSPFAYWVTQHNDEGEFDEYKLFLGYDSQAEAKKAYEDHIPKKYFGGMREGTIHQIKALLNQEPKEPLSKAVRLMLDAG